MTTRIFRFSTRSLVWLFWTATVFSSVTLGKECLQSSSSRKKLFVDGNEISIRIEVSDRVSHQITSCILSIILREVVHYDSIFVNKTVNATQTLRTITGCDHPGACDQPRVYIPDSMVNMEVWLTPGFNLEGWVATQKVEDAGPLGPLGRTNWYISDSYVNSMWDKSVVIDHWRAFQNSTLVAPFDLSQDSDLKFKIFDPKNDISCPDPECRTYEPEQCKNGAKCATLLADYPESTRSVLTEKIRRLNLLVRVAWIGNHLDSEVTKRANQNRTVLFYNWKPNTLTSLGQFTAVAFPQCENDLVGCSYGVNQLQKVAWSKLKEHAPEVFGLIRNINFTHDQYLHLLKLYKEESKWGVPNVESVACLWLTDMEHIWHTWIPQQVTDKHILYIGGIFPLSGNYWQQKGVVTAAQMAVDAINRNSNYLKDYRLELTEADGACAQDVVMKCFISYITQNSYPKMVGILGPACSDTLEPIVGVARHFHTVIISYSAEGSLSQMSDQYPFFFRTIPENRYFRNVYQSLFRELEWHRFATFSEDGQRYAQYLSRLQQDMLADGFTFVLDLKLPRDGFATNVSTYLKELKDKNSRIIIAEMTDRAARAVMCEAYRHQMTAKYYYQWFLPMWYTEDWYNTDQYNNKPEIYHEDVQCTTEEMKEAIDGYMSLAFKFYADDNAIMQENKTIKEWMETYVKNSGDKGYNVSRYGGYAYDAMWVYAAALEKLLQECDSHVSTLHTPNTTRRLAQLINETRMEGTTGSLSFEGSSRRLTEIVIWQWRDGNFHAIGTYTLNNSEGATIRQCQEQGNLTLNQSAIVWMNPEGKKPGDGTVPGEDISSCPVEDFRAFLGVKCDVAIVVANLIGFFIFISIIIVAFIMFKRRYDKRVKVTEARMRELGLIASSGIPCLDEWEMPRDQIVINRKIGEGAFGTVYGGEAVIGDNGWVAVAVKTLKLGASIEEKLDFLSEAEMMKRFDHMNIVRLLGVCTIGEPVYTVMEFMLYGDLKTFLLARRHLVNDKDNLDYKEVSSRRLTAMALDIARGLSYLADLKYIHRDLACRNCLVNAGHMVKIADFGMCRPMYDSDYYKFNKRGMLPVRWMAPESLMDGIFTTMSDVWSYGVVLYEIITFGSFPYQGLSNNQVLEHVKEFNTLPVPRGSHSELEILLMHCWDRIPQQRPQAKEIVEILANQPELISPCLDLPLASVELEGTDSLEFTIPERKRLHSASSVKRKHGSVDYTVDRSNLQPRRRSLHLENGGSWLSSGMSSTRSSMVINPKDYVILHLQRKELRRAKSARGLSSHKVTKL